MERRKVVRFVSCMFFFLSSFKTDLTFSKKVNFVRETDSEAQLSTGQGKEVEHDIKFQDEIK